MNSKKRILIFSDFDSVRNIIVKGLASKGYEVVETKTFAEASKELNGTSFGLIITDNDVRNKQGRKLIEQVRKLSNYLYTPLMLMHSGNKEQLQEEYSEFNIACFINKPFDMQNFYSIISRLA